MCSCPLITTKNLVTCSLSSTMISFSSTVRRCPCASTRACWAEVRTGNISLGVLPGGGDKASSDVAVGVSFMQSSLPRLVDECDQLRNDLLRRFFHKPVAFAFDDNSFDVCIDQTSLLNQEFSGSFFPSQHQHRHCQFRFGKMRKVLCILFEVAEDFETRAHPAGLRIRSGIKLSIRFGYRVLWVGGKIIPEMLEVDPFTSGNQLERGFAVKVKVPEIS